MSLGDGSLAMDYFKFKCLLSLGTFFFLIKDIDGISCYSNAAGSRAHDANY